MDKKPGAVLHMTRWGFLSGIVLATLFIVFMAGFSDSNATIWANLPLIAYIAFFFGGIPGTILGLIEGFVLRWILRDIPFPFTKVEMKKKRLPVYSSTLFIPLLAILFLSILVSQGNTMIMLGFNGLFGIPTIIASIASVYAAHRYLFRLRLWSEGTDTRKIKAKHEQYNHSRLVDKNGEEDFVIPEIKASERIERD